MSAKIFIEEEIEEDLKWCFGVKGILHTGKSKYQDIELIESGPFGKVLVLDGKLQSAEADEFVYHELLVHPASLLHPNPKKVFIMGGGEGSTAREALRHTGVEKVLMCDIDEVVVDFCKKYLTDNAEAFKNPRLQVVINDARAELENSTETWDIIIGDLADPVEGGPCYKLYTQGFYEKVIKPRLSPGGIFVTQAGPAGILSHREVYTSIYNTLKSIFPHVTPYAAHIPSYADTWGWIMASEEPLPDFDAKDIDERLAARVAGETRYFDGSTFLANVALNKHVKKSLQEEKHVYTEESARFIHGKGLE